LRRAQRPRSLKQTEREIANLSAALTTSAVAVESLAAAGRTDRRPHDLGIEQGGYRHLLANQATNEAVSRSVPQCRQRSLDLNTLVAIISRDWPSPGVRAAPYFSFMTMVRLIEAEAWTDAAIALIDVARDP